MKFKYLTNLLRIRQWYKNLVVFLAIFFSANFLNINYIYLTSLAFLSLSLVSSSGYILNDLIDLKKDRLHPEKRTRPLAAGKINQFIAAAIAIILLILGISLSLQLGKMFFYFVLGLFVLTQIYTLILKNIVFADILTIATLFVIRAISGAYVINVKVSPWLILCPFFLSIFLSVGKRHADLSLLKEEAHLTRKTLQEYNSNLTTSLMNISTTLLIISYALYSFLSEHNNLLYTLPFALFVIFRYYYLIQSGSAIARHPERIIKDKEMLIGILLWATITALLIYL